MYLTADKVVNALLKAQAVLAEVEIFAGDTSKIPISIDQLHQTVSRLSEYSIDLKLVSFEAHYIYGRCEKYEGRRAVIDIKYDLPKDWRRFVTAKELMHLMIDEDEDMSPYGDQTLEKLVQDGHIGVISTNGSELPSQSELIAEVAAIELLYPIQLRLDDLKETASQMVNHKKTAITYGIPINYVETAFSSQYLSVIRQAAEQFMISNSKE